MSILVACSSAGDTGIDDATGLASAPIIHGSDSDAREDEAVLMQIRADLGMYACTATLLAPNLVLTARHCVSQLHDDDPTITDTCDPRLLGDDSPAENMSFFVGPRRPGARTKPAAKGKQIFHDQTTEGLCGHDIALVLLDREIPNAKIAKVRLTDSTRAGEKITAVGWGMTEKTDDPAVRQHRTGIEIDSVRPGSTPERGTAADFQVGESTCHGDSGGPALSEKTHAVIGVVSRGDNGSPDERHPVLHCIDNAGGGGKTWGVYTKTSSAKDVIQRAAAASGHELQSE
ncbi:S1 family peptidase [Pendulispora brunnea]|uniref:S1 family peptidase n=1 Tax=Pendulispora brunnea TaxID=2905690 RepID=A0ABZ2KC73_9BACT